MYKAAGKLVLDNSILTVGSKSSVLLVARYSRGSDTKSPYKIVGAKYQRNESDVITHENDPNWELFGPKNNRFYLSGGLSGPAWMSSNSTLNGKVDLNKLIDFKSKDKKRLHISTKKCPLLIRKNLHEMFPSPEVITENNNLSLITLSQGTENIDHEQAAIDYILSAKEICAKLRLHGFWADFLNPMSGRAYHSYSPRSLFKIDQRFRGLCMKFDEVNEDCILISEDTTKFSGNIFTNIHPNLEFIKDLVVDEE